MLFQVAKCGVICGCLEATKSNTLLLICNLYLIFGEFCLVVSSFCNSKNYSSLCNPHQDDSYCVVDPKEPQSFFHMTVAFLALSRWLHLSWLWNVSIMLIPNLEHSFLSPGDKWSEARTRRNAPLWTLCRCRTISEYRKPVPSTFFSLKQKSNGYRSLISIMNYLLNPQEKEEQILYLWIRECSFMTSGWGEHFSFSFRSSLILAHMHAHVRTHTYIHTYMLIKELLTDNNGITTLH